MIGLLLLLCLVIIRNIQNLQEQLEVFASFILELCLTAMHIENMAMTSPLFSLTDWQYMPFQQKTIDNIRYWESYGGSMRANRFVVDKENEEKRLVVLGASSAHGSNHLKEEAFAAILEQRWRIFSQDKKRFVWNLGIGGTTSNGVLHMGLWALEQQVDGLIIYYGHNEAAQFFTITTDCSHFTFNSTNADASVSVQNLLSLAKSTQIEQAVNYTCKKRESHPFG